MADIVDKQTRSRMMSGIRGTNTCPELQIRRALHKRGFRYSLHRKIGNSKPDLCLPRYNAVIFVHGCFWHRHEGCKYTTTPATRTEFWQQKFKSNVVRDRNQYLLLENSGWRVAIVWECALRKKNLDQVAELLTTWLKGGVSKIEIPDLIINLTGSDFDG